MRFHCQRCGPRHTGPLLGQADAGLLPEGDATRVRVTNFDSGRVESEGTPAEVRAAYALDLDVLRALDEIERGTADAEIGWYRVERVEPREARQCS